MSKKFRKYRKSPNRVCIDYTDGKSIIHMLEDYLKQFDKFCENHKFMFFSGAINKPVVLDKISSYLEQNGNSLKYFRDFVNTCMEGTTLHTELADEFLKTHTTFVDKFDGMTLMFLVTILPTLDVKPDMTLADVKELYIKSFDSINIYERSRISLSANVSSISE